MTALDLPTHIPRNSPYLSILCRFVGNRRQVGSLISSSYRNHCSTPGMQVDILSQMRAILEDAVQYLDLV